MRLVVISDLHLDYVTAGYPRFDEVAAHVRKSVAYACEQKVDAWVCLGDVMDPDSGPCVFRCVSFLAEMAMALTAHHVPSIWVAGNHDVIEDGSGFTTLSPLRHVSGARVCERPTALPVGDCVFVALPFTASSHGYDVADVVRRFDDERERVVIGSHLHVRGIIPGEETIEMPRGREVLLPYEQIDQVRAGKPTVLLQGHYHRRQVFLPAGGSLPVQVVGAAARLTFGEESSTPGFLDVRF